jgi:hypothetical protein
MVVELKLDSAPLDVTNDALWRVGTPGTPQIGDLWLLSWNGDVLGLALVSGVGDGYLLVWPVTLQSDLAFRPAVEVPDSPLGTPLFVWPTRETGIGAHVLHRRFGTLLPEHVMALVAEAAEQGLEGPLRYAPDGPRHPAIDAADDAMVDRWESICLNIWPHPRPGSAPLNRRLLRTRGLRPSDLAEALGVTTPDAVALYSGEQSPDKAQIAALESHFRIPAEELLDPLTDEAARELLSPVWKDDILAVGRHYGEDESAARDHLRQEYALAARATGGRTDRMRAAVHRLLERTPN